MINVRNTQSTLIEQLILHGACKIIQVASYHTNAYLAYLHYNYDHVEDESYLTSHSSRYFKLFFTISII